MRKACYGHAVVCVLCVCVVSMRKPYLTEFENNIIILHCLCLSRSVLLASSPISFLLSCLSLSLSLCVPLSLSLYLPLSPSFRSIPSPLLSVSLSLSLSLYLPLPPSPSTSFPLPHQSNHHWNVQQLLSYL